MRTAVSPRLCLSSTLLIFLLLAAGADAFLYAQCGTLSPPVYGVVRNLAAVDGRHGAVAIVNAGHSRGYSDSPPAQLTIASAFSGDAQAYSFVTRPIVPAVEAGLEVRGIGLEARTFYEPGETEDDAGAVWALFEDLNARLISVKNGTVQRQVDFAGTPMAEFEHTWLIGRLSDGTSTPVISGSVNTCWWALNGSMVCIDLSVKVSAVVGHRVYALTLAAQGIVLHTVDLDNATVTHTHPYAPLNATFDLLDLASPCAIVANHSLHFLFRIEASAALLTVNLTSLALNASLLGGDFDPYMFDGLSLACGPTAETGHYLVWSTDGGAVLFAELDLANATMRAVLVLSEESTPTAAATSARGDLFLAWCTDLAPSSFASVQCAVGWLPLFKGIIISLKEAASVAVITPDTRLTDSAQPSPDLAVLTVEATIAEHLMIGFLVANISAPAEPTVQAWIGINRAVELGTVDPATLTLYLIPYSYTIALYILNWNSFTTISTLATAAHYESLALDAQYPFWVWPTPTSGSLYAAINGAAMTESHVFSLTFAPNVTHTLLATINATVSDLGEGPDNVAFLTSPDRVTQFNGSVLRTWPLPSYLPFFLQLDAVMAPDGSTYFLLLVDGTFPSDAVFCVAIDLIAANRPPIVTNVTLPVGFGMFARGSAVISAGSLNLGLLFWIVKFDLNCNPLELFYTKLVGTPPIVLTRSDQMIFADLPSVSPIYLDCGLGNYRNLSSGECSSCPNGSVSPLVDTQACLPCPARTLSDAARVRCLCTAGYYSASNGTDCDACPIGGVCNGANTLLPASGYWRVNASATRFYPCPYADGCNGSDACAAGYTGPVCAVCAAQHALVARACLKCEGRAATTAFWAAGAVVYLAAFLLVLYSGPGYVSVLKSFVSFAQIVTFPTTGPMPRLLASKLALITRFLSLANLQFVSLLSPDCLLHRHVSFPLETVASALTPLLLILLIALIIALPWRRIADLLHISARPRASHAPDPFNESPPDLGTRFESYKQSGIPIRVILFIALTASPSITQQLASFYTCASVGGTAYLALDYTVKCYTGQWTAFAAAISLLLVLFAVGLPVALFVLLYGYRSRLDLAFLHSSYRDEYYWWDLTEQIRKLTLLLVNAVLAPRLPAYYGPLSLSVSVVALSVHLHVRPYRRDRDMWYQTADLVGVALYFLWTLTPAQDDAADNVAWVYWLYAVCYTIATLVVMLQTPVLRAWSFLRSKLSQGAQSDASSEADALLPKSAR